MEKKVADMTLIEVLDKNVNQEQLARDLIAKYALGKIDQLSADVQSGKIDLIPGTQIDNILVAKLIEAIKASLVA